LLIFSNKYMYKTTAQWWGKKTKTTYKIGNHANVYMLPCSTRKNLKV
jgi:hypothetical protein